MLISSIQDLKKFISEKNFDDIFFAVTFPKDAFGVEELFSLKIISYDNHPITKLLPSNTHCFSLLDNSKDTLKRRSTNVLLSHPATKKYILSFQQSKPNILVFKPSPSLEIICQKNDWLLLANPSKLNRLIENKINFSHILTKLNLPQPQHQIEKLADISYEYYAHRFGQKFFIQFPRGFAGSSTFLIESQKILHDIQKKYLNYPTKISQQIIGPTYSLNACIVSQSTNKQQIVIQPPFFQITNLPDLNNSAGGTCGNIYCQESSPKINIKQLYSDVRLFGNYLYSKNYRGIFGLDFVIDSKTGQHFFIECNPRLTASIPMVTKLQIKNLQIPLLAIHVLEFLKLDYQLSDSAIENISSKPLIGSQIIFRNTKNESCAPPFSFTSGVYTSDKPFNNILELKNIFFQDPTKLHFQREGKDILSLKKDEEFLVLSEPKDRIISPDIEFLRIQSLNGLLP